MSVYKCHLVYVCAYTTVLIGKVLVDVQEITRIQQFLYFYVIYSL